MSGRAVSAARKGRVGPDSHAAETYERKESMKTIVRMSLIAATLSMNVRPGHAADASTPGMFTLSGQVSGASNKHPVYVMLWDSTGFTRKAVRQIQLSKNSGGSFRFTVPLGRWALSAFEDRNGNGELDMGRFGPREPSGMWHPFHARRKPRFEDVAAFIDRDIPDANIQLR